METGTVLAAPVLFLHKNVCNTVYILLRFEGFFPFFKDFSGFFRLVYVGCFRDAVFMRFPVCLNRIWNVNIYKKQITSVQEMHSGTFLVKKSAVIPMPEISKESFKM